jgi:hypothetical protein
MLLICLGPRAEAILTYHLQVGHFSPRAFCLRQGKHLILCCDGAGAKITHPWVCRDPVTPGARKRTTGGGNSAGMAQQWSAFCQVVLLDQTPKGAALCLGLSRRLGDITLVHLQERRNVGLFKLRDDLCLGLF